MNKKIIVYMPALNEAKTIQKVLQSIPENIKGVQTITKLIVNDGSTDATEEEAKLAGATVISHGVNRGVGFAFQTAVNYALKEEADILVSIDADGQFDVNQISKMIQPIIDEEASFCIGNRFAEKRHEHMPKIKHWGNMQVNKIISFITKTKIKDASCGFRAYSKKSLINLNLHGKFTYTHETILDLINKGFKVEQIPVSVTYFEERKSRVANNVLSYGYKTLKIITKSLRDYKPFYFFGMISLIFFILALISGGFVLLHWILKERITPYKFIGISSLIVFLVSIIFLVLAFLADMLGRIRLNQEKMLLMLKQKKFNDD
ncbi:glycosyltransferase family 2 protein [Tamlana sp. 2201CG12-4]|uniref:glycosyltransferase family 2 protein n=1 Tax=Tamlana sp. 2201CG12-4 TaxID=3112582 RepID=UPI002DBCDF78|nr:glycosyltransferase family 2 protein [Tamlana sp. 2201CG12-4]MEC3907351.1 glycosyltransferase family 2 protein [Tamlana sp. 2201CG12-4]